MSNITGVWVLGNQVDGVEKCLNWYEYDIPNFADCNVLIADMTTLDKSTLHGRDYDKCKEVFEGIFARFKAGLEIYCIIQESFTVQNLEEIDIHNYF